MFNTAGNKFDKRSTGKLNIRLTKCWPEPGTNSLNLGTSVPDGESVDANRHLKTVADNLPAPPPVLPTLV